MINKLSAETVTLRQGFERGSACFYGNNLSLLINAVFRKKETDYNISIPVISLPARYRQVIATLNMVQFYGIARTNLPGHMNYSSSWRFIKFS
jgi:hypothetical protein